MECIQDAETENSTKSEASSASSELTSTSLRSCFRRNKQHEEGTQSDISKVRRHYLVVWGENRQGPSIYRRGVSDSALPPVIHTISKCFELRVKDKPDTRLRCFKSWGKQDRRNFESWQWTVLSPYFTRNTPNKITHYILQRHTILTFLELEPVGRRGGSGKVEQVKIHHDPSWVQGICLEGNEGGGDRAKADGRGDRYDKACRPGGRPKGTPDHMTFN